MPLIFQSCFGLNLAFTTCPLLWTPSAELFHGGNLESIPITLCVEMPSGSMLHCFSSVIFWNVLFEGKKGNSLGCSWIVILQSSITTSQMRLGSCFPNTVYVYILYTLSSLVFTVWNVLQHPCPLLQSMANVVLKTPLVTFCSREQGGYWDILASFLECISICILYNESPNPSHITYALITLCSPKIALIAFASAGVTLYDEQYFICKQRRQILGMGRGRNWLSWICYSAAL